jgi:predicted dehydrogenase
MVAAASVSTRAFPILGSNDRLQVGFLGIGIRGSQLLKPTVDSMADKVRVVAVCDGYTGYVQRAVQTVNGACGTDPAAYGQFRRMLDDKNVEAVVIATPEHRHVEHVLMALAAGKDVYVEKPLSHTIEEGPIMMAAQKKSGRIVQVGTQRRSSLIYQKAREMVQAGMLGKVAQVRAFWHRNTLVPQWRYAIPDDASPQTADWEAFLGPAPQRPWDASRYFQWRLYWDYSGGIATDLMTHQIDGVHNVMSVSGPTDVYATGGIYQWNDGREVPDTFNAILTYPSGFIVDYCSFFSNQHYGYGEQFLGSEGTLEVMNNRSLAFYPEKLTENGKDVTPERVKARAAVSIEAKDIGFPNEPTPVHLENFYDCVKSRKTPNCPLEIGDQAAVPCHLATKSLKERRPVRWDAATRTIA